MVHQGVGSPFAVLRSRFGLRYSRVRGRRQSKFLASSSTGGARNFYPTGSRADFQFPSDARPPKALRASRGYYFNAAVQNAYSSRRLSRGFFSEGAPAPCTELPKCEAQKLSPPGRAALIRHGAAQRRTVPPSPRGRLSAPAPCTKSAL